MTQPKWKPNIVQNIIGKALFGDFWPELVERAEVKERDIE